jgi:hypothetical protein
MYRRDAPKIIVAMAVMAIFSFQSTRPIAAQTTYKVITKKAATPGEWPPYKAPRTADGKPNLNGIWQALVTANIDVLDHDAQPGPSPQIMGEYGAWPGGQGIVEGGEIPYKPEALAKKKANADNRMVINITADEDRHATGDPELKCYRPGIPRANYMPFPFQIIQSTDKIMVAYEFAHTLRTIYMKENAKESPKDAPSDSWMGWSHGRWEGDTLVIDSTGFAPWTWFDRAGDYHSEALHVVERYTLVSPYHILYEATIEDPNVFTRPWKMSFPLYRRMEKNIQLVDFNCVAFVEDLLYSPYYKKDRSK